MTDYADRRLGEIRRHHDSYPFGWGMDNTGFRDVSFLLNAYDALKHDLDLATKNECNAKAHCKFKNDGGDSTLYVKCPECGGRGATSYPYLCKVCRGVGYVEYK